LKGSTIIIMNNTPTPQDEENKGPPEPEPATIVEVQQKEEPNITSILKKKICSEDLPAKPVVTFHKNKSSTSMIEEPPSITVPIPKDSLSILIGTGGRNICLVVKFSNVFIQTNNHEGTVQIYARNADSDMLLARRMITSIVAGGVLRWFNHPSSTQKYFHVSVRAQLKDLVSSMTEDKCSLQLLRARNGHLCLFIWIEKWDPDSDTMIAPLISKMRPVILAKISELSC